MEKKADTVGERIKLVRKDTKMNQKDFGEELGVSQSHISNIEKGADNPSYTLIKFICSKYDIDEEWLTTGKGSMYVYSNYNVYDDTIINKYILNKKYLDDIFNSLEGEERIGYVQAIGHLTSLYTYQFKSVEERNKYLQLLSELIDNLEILIHSIHILETINGKKIGKFFVEQMMSCEQMISEIEKDIRSMADVFLASYDTEYRLVK